jgi:hypothetical protein
MCIICEGGNITNIQTLNCHYCPQLISIPNIEGLQHLYCPDCPQLISIPNIEGLQTLICSNCPWISTNKGFEERIHKLIVLQCWYRKMILYRNYITRINEIVPIYYHPDCKGGYFAKRRIRDFILDCELKIQ